MHYITVYILDRNTKKPQSEAPAETSSNPGKHKWLWTLRASTLLRLTRLLHSPWPRATSRLRTRYTCTWARSMFRQIMWYIVCRNTGQCPDRPAPAGATESTIAWHHIAIYTQHTTTITTGKKKSWHGSSYRATVCVCFFQRHVCRSVRNCRVIKTK